MIYWSTHPLMVPDNSAAKRWLSMYIYSMEAFGLEDLHVIGNPGIAHGYKISHQEHESLHDVIALYDDIKVVASVGTAPQGQQVTNLTDYRHPEKALYVIGGDYADVEADVCREYDADFVTIDNDVGMRNFWSPVVAGILLRDRWVKNGRNQ